MSFSLRPPTKKMIEKLLDCHEKTKNANHPCLQEDLKGALAGLYRRGLVNTRFQDVNGKKILCLFVTDTGIKFIKAMDTKK